MKLTTRDLINIATMTAGMILLLWFVSAMRPAAGMDHGFDKSAPLTKYLESLMRPDMPGSCCGKGDAYQVERYRENADGTFSVWLSEEGKKAIVFPDGKYRSPVIGDPEIRVPAHRVNKLDDDQDNPSDTSWIFMSVSGGSMANVFCFIRHPMGG